MEPLDPWKKMTCTEMFLPCHSSVTATCSPSFLYSQEARKMRPKEFKKLRSQSSSTMEEPTQAKSSSKWTSGASPCLTIGITVLGASLVISTCCIGALFKMTSRIKWFGIKSGVSILKRLRNRLFSRETTKCVKSQGPISCTIAARACCPFMCQPTTKATLT